LHNKTLPDFVQWVQFSTPEQPTSYIFQIEAQGLLIAHVLIMLAVALVLVPLWIFPISASRLSSPAKRVLQPAITVVSCASLLFGIAMATLHRKRTPDLYENALHRKAGFALALYLLVVAGFSLLPHIKALAQSNAANHFSPLPQDEDREERGQPSPVGSFRSAQSQETLHALEQDELHERCQAHLATASLRERLIRIGIISNKLFLAASFYAQILLGIATLGGLFRGHEVFNGLAHWIKASVFFIFGIWVFLRYLGITASIGHAWNAPLSGRQPVSAEQIECGLIFTYGILNLFLERLGHASAPISHTDIQHMSIAWLFACAGGIGLLLESRLLRSVAGDSRNEARRPVLNIMPSLITFFTGLLMSQHHQDTAFASTAHAIWGYFFCIAAVFRLLTYISIFVRPEIVQCHTPSRPPTEALVAFCLIAGALIFMASSRDVVQALEFYEVHTFFLVTLGAAGSLCVLVWTCYLAVLMHLSAETS
jgi:hypothetical protein